MTVEVLTPPEAAERLMRAEAAIQRVRQIHVLDPNLFPAAQSWRDGTLQDFRAGCTACIKGWPCATIEALDAPAEALAKDLKPETPDQRGEG